MAVISVRTWRQGYCPGCERSYPSWTVGQQCQQCETILIVAGASGVAVHVDRELFERPLSAERPLTLDEIAELLGVDRGDR